MVTPDRKPELLKQAIDQGIVSRELQRPSESWTMPYYVHRSTDLSVQITAEPAGFGLEVIATTPTPVVFGLTEGMATRVRILRPEIAEDGSYRDRAIFSRGVRLHIPQGLPTPEMIDNSPALQQARKAALAGSQS